MSPPTRRGGPDQGRPLQTTATVIPATLVAECDVEAVAAELVEQVAGYLAGAYRDGPAGRAVVDLGAGYDLVAHVAVVRRRDLLAGLAW